MIGNGRKDHMEKPLLGAVLCCTGVPPEQRTRFADVIAGMGGEHKLDLTSDVTHLLVEVSDAPTTVHLTAKYKYVAANREDIQVLQPAWLEAVRQSWMTGEKFDLHALEEEYKLPVFAGLSVCLTGFEDLAFRAQLQDCIIAQGGDYRGDLTKNVTHLIANAPEGKKYQYAEQWHVRVVSLRWFKDCLERGMVLEESLYHPTLPFEEQGKGAWDRDAKAKVQKGKRIRHEMPPQEAPRKLRRTASSKLGSQSDSLWGDIMGGGFDAPPGSELPARLLKSQSTTKSVILEPESFIMDSRTPQNQEQQSLNALPQIYQGYFSNQAFLVHGFALKNKSLLQRVLKDNGAFLLGSHIDISNAPHMARGLFVIVPYTMPSTDIPSVKAMYPSPRVVTDMWVERCLAYKAFLEPDEHPANTPLKRFPIDGFRDLIINSTGFESIDLLHISKLVKLVGAKYDETLQTSISVLVCNKAKANPEKQHYAASWGIPVVSDTWLWACLQGGRLQPFDAYMISTFPRGENNIGSTAKDKKTERLLQEKHQGKEHGWSGGRKDQFHEDRHTRSTMPADDVVAFKRRKDSEQTEGKPGADFLENPVSPSAQHGEDCGRKTHPHQQEVENEIRSGGIQLSVDPNQDEVIPLQEISTNPPPRHAVSFPRKKKPLFRSFDGSGGEQSTAASIDLAPAAPVPTSTGKTEYVPPQTDSINDAIHDLLNQTSKARSSAASTMEGATKKTGLLGRALSNKSNSSRHSRASSVDSMNTDGVGSVIGGESSPSGKPKGSIGRTGSFTGRAKAKAMKNEPLQIDFVDPSLCRDEFADEEPTPPMTQLGYGEHEDAVKIREKLAEKRRKQSRQGQETVSAMVEPKRIKDDDAILGAGWGAGRRTRHKERSPKGMAGF